MWLRLYFTSYSIVKLQTTTGFNNFNVIVMEELYVHGAEVFAKT